MLDWWAKTYGNDDQTEWRFETATGNNNAPAGKPVGKKHAKRAVGVPVEVVGHDLPRTRLAQRAGDRGRRSGPEVRRQVGGVEVDDRGRDVEELSLAGETGRARRQEAPALRRPEHTLLERRAPKLPHAKM